MVSIRQFALNNQLLVAHFGNTAEVEGVIQSDPIIKAGKIIGSKLQDDQFSVLFKLTKIEGVSVNLPTRLKYDLNSRVEIDQKVKLKARIIKSKERKVAALLIANGKISILTGSRNLFSATSGIRESFRKLVKHSDAGSLIPGMVLGDTSLQNSVFADKMRRVGLSHLTAVSGANFALVASFLLWLLQFIVAKIQIRIQIVTLILILFIFLVRPTPSVLRASVMTGVLLFAKQRGEKSTGIPALGCAIALLILLDPFQAIDPGFSLSVLATAGILILSPVIKYKLESYIKHEWLIEAISIPLSATIFCIPIIVLLSSQLSLITVPANILVAPVIAPITVLGFIAAVFSPFIPTISTILLFIATLIANWIVTICQIMNSLPVITFNQSGFFIALFMVFITVALTKKLWLSVVLILLLALQLFFNSLIWPGKDWQITNCDVGQGDGLVINLGDSSGLVIDTGPDPLKINQCLHKLKIKKIPLLVLTHFHADHVGGISSVIKDRKIGQVWISNLSEPKASYKSVLTLLKGIELRTVKEGDRFTSSNNNLDIRVLWPRTTTQAFQTLPGDGSTVNNSSISLIIRIKSLSIFVAGDIEPAVQEIISKSGYLAAVDVLKVCHHGSKYQYLPMLDQLKPKIAIISVGAGNSYGHPDPEYINELKRRNIKVLRTDISGGVSLAPPNRIRVTGKEWWQIRWG
ncbi:MAG: hypothetical protein RIS93_533 [Actinomycetota bacterium]